jgi:uncharacterized membrane protein YgcG
LRFLPPQVMIHRTPSDHSDDGSEAVVSLPIRCSDLINAAADAWQAGARAVQEALATGAMQQASRAFTNLENARAFYAVEGVQDVIAAAMFSLKSSTIPRVCDLILQSCSRVSEKTLADDILDILDTLQAFNSFLAETLCHSQLMLSATFVDQPALQEWCSAMASCTNAHYEPIVVAQLKAVDDLCTAIDESYGRRDATSLLASFDRLKSLTALDKHLNSKATERYKDKVGSTLELFRRLKESCLQAKPGEHCESISFFTKCRSLEQHLPDIKAWAELLKSMQDKQMDAIATHVSELLAKGQITRVKTLLEQLSKSVDPNDRIRLNTYDNEVWQLIQEVEEEVRALFQHSTDANFSFSSFDSLVKRAVKISTLKGLVSGDPTVLAVTLTQGLDGAFESNFSDVLSHMRNWQFLHASDAYQRLAEIKRLHVNNNLGAAQRLTARLAELDAQHLLKLEDTAQVTLNKLMTVDLVHSSKIDRMIKGCRDMEQQVRAFEGKIDFADILDTLHNSIRSFLKDVQQKIQESFAGQDVATVDKMILRLEEVLEIQSLLPKSRSDAEKHLAEARNGKELLGKAKQADISLATNPQLIKDLEQLRVSSFTNYYKAAEPLVDKAQKALEEVQLLLERLVSGDGTTSSLAKVHRFAHGLQNLIDSYPDISKDMPRFKQINQDLCEDIRSKMDAALQRLTDSEDTGLEVRQGCLETLRLLCVALRAHPTGLPQAFLEELDQRLQAEIKSNGSACESLEAAKAELQKLDLFCDTVAERHIKTADRLDSQINLMGKDGLQKRVRALKDVLSELLGRIKSLPAMVQVRWTEDGKYAEALKAWQNVKALEACTNTAIKQSSSDVSGKIADFVASQLEAVKRMVQNEFDAQCTKQDPDFTKFNRVFEHAEKLDAILATGSSAAGGASIPEPLVDTMVRQFQPRLQIMVDQSRSQRNASATLEDHADLIVTLKRYVKDISNIKIRELVHRMSHSIMTELFRRKVDLYLLGTKLQDLGPLGMECLEEHPEFRAVKIEMHNQLTRTAAISISDTLQGLKKLGDKYQHPISDECLESLQLEYEKYSAKFDAHLEKYLTDYSPEPLSKLVTKVVRRGRQMDGKDYREVKAQIPELLAGVFAIWSIDSTGALFKATRRKEVLIQPHPVQVVAILRLLGVDQSANGSFSAIASFLGLQSDEQLLPPGHFVQVGTGEGKSILLGGLSAVLALLGCTVDCACYSRYLSQRDYKAFQRLFELLGITNEITYATLSDLAEMYINQHGNIRDLVKARINAGGSSGGSGGSGGSANGGIINGGSSNSGRASGKTQGARAAAAAATGLRVLLIDEVDVFFSKAFFGSTYNPACEIKTKDTETILRHIWTHRADADLTLQSIQALPSYRSILQQYGTEFQQCLDREIRQMLYATTKFNDPPYKVLDGKIAYKGLDCYETNIAHGYRTTFAYLSEAEAGRITHDCLTEKLALNITCGSFSYAEIVSKYDCIMGEWVAAKRSVCVCACVCVCVVVKSRLVCRFP